MGSTPRTLNNVVSYINTQLKAAGVLTRFGISKLPAPANTVQVGTQTITLPDAAPSYALQVDGDTSESVTFTAAATAGAVYVSQTAGAPPTTTTTVTNGQLTTTTAPDTQTQQLLKIQTDTSTTPDQPPPPVVPAGTPYNVDGKVFSSTLDSGVSAVHATATGADGSVYVLANVDGTVGGQAIQGTQDVALMKYDSAGNLMYTRTLGAADSASGLALAVSADGQVAIAGSTTGPLDTSTNVDDPTKSDSFVTVFDAKGQEEWTSVRGTRENDQATAVAFGADGSVYVAGQADSNMPGATEVGGQDGYLEGFKWNGKSGDASAVSTEFTTQFGSTGTDKVAGIAVNGSNIVVAGTDGPDAVVRQFALNPTGAPTLTATRDLGDLQGGSVVGVGYDSNGQVIVAGSAHNAALDAGTVTNASAGGSDAFVAKLAPGLAPSASDTVAYYGGSGNDTVTGMAIQGTSVWLTGQVGSDLAGTTPIGTKDAYVAELDPTTGQSSFVRRFTAAQGQTQTTSIAVSAAGSSALDRLGLPTGTLSYTDSPLLTASTSLRAGDTFQVRSQQGGVASTVTIAANDTLDTLAQKIVQASGYRATATVLTLSGQRQLQIKPANSSDTIEILPGSAGANALVSLGLNQGVIQSLPTSSSASSSTKTQKTVGLNLDPSLNLSTPAGVAAAGAAIQSAMAAVRSAYNTISAAAQPATTNPGKTGGTVPQYLTDQIANYTAALQRLTGGSTSTSTSALAGLS